MWMVGPSAGYIHGRPGSVIEGECTPFVGVPPAAMSWRVAWNWRGSEGGCMEASPWGARTVRGERSAAAASSAIHQQGNTPKIDHTCH